MKRILIATVVALLQAGCSAKAGDQAPTAGDVIIQAQFDNATMAYERRDAVLVLDSLEMAMRDDIFAQLSPGRRYQVAKMYAQAAQVEGEWAKAHEAYVRATSLPQADLDDWNGRLHSAISSSDGPDAYLAFRHLREARVNALQTFGGVTLEQFDQLLRNLPQPEARLALGREMERTNWASPFAYDDASGQWLHYVEALLETGDVRKATEIADRITDPMVMMAMRADARFDKIVAANPRLRDPEAAAEAYLRATQAYAEANPRLIGGKIAVIRALSILHRPADALPVADAVTRAIVMAPRGQPPFDDMENSADLEVWRNSVLVSLGRTDEAVAGRISGASCGCGPWTLLSVARTLLEADRAAEAARWLAEMPETGMGPKGRMEFSLLKACAAARLANSRELQANLDFLAAHEAWKPEALVDGLVCADRIDAAGEVLKRQLADPRLRIGALTRLQVYAAEPSVLAFTGLQAARWGRLRGDPSVQAQVAKVGRINSYNLHQWASVS